MLEELGSRSGVKTSLAATLGIKASYLSHVLKEKAHLTLEQVEAANTFLKHTADQTHYFILLAQRDRAGTHSLKKHFTKQIDDFLHKQEIVKDRLQISPELTDEQVAEYYSSWLYAAIHIATMIPKYNSRIFLADYFNLPLERIDEILHFLTRVGVVNDSKGKLSPGSTLIHLKKNSAHIAKHHTSWRLKAIEAAERRVSSNMHYSGVLSLSEKDFEKIKEILLESLRESIDTVKKSREEKLAVLNIDLFELK